jgi:chromosome segregation ATPase
MSDDLVKRLRLEAAHDLEWSNDLDLVVKQAADRIESLELNIISLKGAQVTHLALVEELEADLMDKEAECRFLRGECNMLRAKLEKAVEALREVEEDCKLRADPTGLVPIGRGAWIMLTEALAQIEKEKTND